MNMKKITAFAAAVVMAAGICTGVPVGTDTSPLAVTAEAANSDFVIETGENGDKFISGYNGKGGNITIPDGVEYISGDVFKENTTITGITFPKSCKEIARNAFEKCTSLKTVVFEGDAEIGDNAFYRCSSLTSVTVKGSIYRFGIGHNAFSDCISLKTVKIEKDENEFSIDNGAFENCNSLSSINIPGKCISIGYRAFLNCLSLETLTIPPQTTCGGYAGLDGNHPDIEQYCFGYVWLYDKSRVRRGSGYVDDYIQRDIVVADGKTGGYFKYWEDDTGWKYKYVVPKQLTVYLTKGSPAEEYCKANGIKYAYGNAPAAAKTSSSSSTSTAAKLAAPTGVNGKTTQNKIVLTWNKVDGAKAYRVYKYDEKTGKYTKYKDVGGTQCTVTGLKASTKYKFKVCALVPKNGKYVAQTATNGFSFTTKAAAAATVQRDENGNEVITL
ncbi:MAG: fibronectin type III domain-containing protein [Ruminococcus sp.]|nr:fibronectin type III domain-containing protein [Ruminococcus sp.]MCM1479070.1 fibronectin type III domain-containing protein [Muribaculaceae bacterium]